MVEERACGSGRVPGLLETRNHLRLLNEGVSGSGSRG